jgi:hypothetical protein
VSYGSEVVQFERLIGRRTTMTTPNNEGQETLVDKNERQAKGGVAGVESKDFGQEDFPKEDPKPEEQSDES